MKINFVSDRREFLRESHLFFDVTTGYRVGPALRDKDFGSDFDKE
ncbi:hypothetical protein [Pontibacter sp. HSC-36F09]|nr:hypothetical protein [Pontibacter sp. HSC-36F09]MCP2045361.1 hypothetical protein [Pontibacter sp. HSC-36F09]